MKRMRITFGDFYDDGHGKYETFNMECNRTPQELADLEIKAEQATGYRFQTNARRGDDVRPTTKIVNEYEDSTIPEEAINDLISQGFDNYIIVSDGTQPVETYALHELEDGVADFAEFFLRWLKMVDPDLEWKWIDDNSNHAIFNCRGYGLFW